MPVKPSVPHFAAVALAMLIAVLPLSLHAQRQSTNDEIQELKEMVLNLQSRVAALERQNAQLRGSRMPDGAGGPGDAAALASATADLRRTEPVQLVAAQVSASTSSASAQVASVLPANLPGGATMNYLLDGYYEYNFNQPTGRANNLRAYDVLSNVFSINQADFIFDLDPDLAAHRRYGFRLDLQFGQATETLQGNPANEPRPEIYRNIFQAYGTYVVPIGHGLNVDFGKWASSLGVEGNYTKDQMNYSRSFYYYFLPFYHTGVRTSYRLNDKLVMNYWVVNGTNQSEPTNGYKDELFGFVLQPTKSLSWTTNYYMGQEHPDVAQAGNCSIPAQPGLCFTPIIPAPNGKIHIVDSYATWQVRPRLTLQGEADYVIEREWANAAPGESSAPSHTGGGVAYAQFLLTPRSYLAVRGEYLSDRGGLFTNETQALKESTITYRYNFGDGFEAFLEYRRDWSNRPYFITSNPASPSSHQDTTTLGLVWWYGGKQGAW